MSSPSSVHHPPADDATQVPFPRLSARTMRFTLGIPTTWTLTPDGSHVLFLRSRSGTERTGLLWRYDVDQQVETLLADPTELLAGDDESLPAAELARRERMRQGGAGITAYSTDEAVRRIAVTVSGRVFVVDVSTAETVEVPVAGPAVDPQLSPDGAWVAYHCDGGLHVAPAGGDQTGRALASASSPTESWGLSDFVHAEEIGRQHSFWWAPDSSSLLVVRVDEAAVTTAYIADPAHPDRAPMAVRYPFAGSANPSTTLWQVGLDGTREEVLPAHEPVEYLVDVCWSAGRPALVTVLDRNQRNMQVLAWEPGAPPQQRRRVHDDCWVDVMPGAPAWWQDQLLTIEHDRSSDTMRLHVDGTPVSPQGAQVRGVLSVDDASVLLSVSQDDRERRVAQYSAAGDWTWLTEPDQITTAKAGGGTLVVRTDPSDGCLPVVVVRRDGATAPLGVHVVRPPVQPRPRHLRRDRPDDPRVAVLLPSEHDGGALPVLMDPYGGPHGQRVTSAARNYLESQWFADQGFVVVVADGPGTPGTPAWERAMAGDMARPALTAQVRALDMLAEQVDVADLTRVAIRGWSFGGYLAAHAVLDRPDLFHAAVAGAPVTDFALYDTGYTERYLGRPQDRPDSYNAHSLLVRAASLERPLMLVHGLADDNVLVANTLRLSSALLAAGRAHHVLPLSGVTHMTPQEVVAENLLLAQRDFLAGHLAHQSG